MIRRFLSLVVGVAAVILFVFVLQNGQQAAVASAWQSKVDPFLLEQIAQSRRDGDNKLEFIVSLAAQADLSAAEGLPTKEAKGRFVFEQLTAVAAATQPELRANLSAVGAEHRPFWVTNAVWVRGDSSLVRELAARSDIAFVYANPRVRLAEPLPEPQKTPTKRPCLAQPGVSI